MLLYILLVYLWGPLLADAMTRLPRSPSDFRTNTTAHLIFNSVSSLLQHWPNTIYRNGHTFVPCTVPTGTLLYHSRPSFDPPPSPEFFAFDVDHSRDLKLGYFDGTSAAMLEGPRDLQDIAFNDRFVSKDEYNPWVHARSMCTWAKRVGLDGIARMEPSFEVIICNIDSDLELVSSRELVYHQTMIFPGQPIPRGPNTTSSPNPRQHPRTNPDAPYFPGPMIPAYPPPPGWQGLQRTFPDSAFEAIRAGMWHNHFPGEWRIVLDYSGIVSAYDETYESLVRARRGVPRVKHRLDGISPNDMARLKSEMEEVVQRERPLVAVNWRWVFQDIVDRYGGRLEDLRYLLGRSDLNPEEIVANARQKILAMLTPFIELPQSKPASAQTNTENRLGLSTDSDSASQNGPDDDWLMRIYDACAKHPTVEFARRRTLTPQETRLANSIDVVQVAICSSLTDVWAEAFGSGDKPLLARDMMVRWKVEVEGLMDWLDWHVWVKCDPPCGLGFQCVLATWPWEVETGDEDIGPACRDRLGGDIF
ncbi:unnamed protein product [Rhizoctonia solani]|uniref:Uncharacterized protein n=1 Tax=Rhizoctonia solani TaxID=456999 RepID=A0A8H3H382_9AGAM|nr:unnamed protein product [Rhizoctonia solani]